MHKIWKIVDPRRVVLAILIFQFMLGVLIHLVVLSSDLNWLSDHIPPLRSSTALPSYPFAPSSVPSAQ